MKDIIIDNVNGIDMKIQYLIYNILKLNNKKIILYAYNGLMFKEHLKLIYPYGKIKDTDFKLIENDNEFIHYIKTNDLTDVTILFSCQYITNNIDRSYIKIREGNLYDLFNINKNVMFFEYYKKQFENSKLINEYLKKHESILEHKKLWIT